MKKRSEMAIKDTWKLEDIMADRQEWERRFGQAESRLPEYEKFRGTLGDSPDALYGCLAFDDELSLELEILYVYARLGLDQDTAQESWQSMFSRAQSLSVQAAERSAFMVPEILALPEGKLENFLQADNGIQRFKRLLERILARKAHVLSGEMEGLLAQSLEATQGAAQIFNMFNNADVRFPEITGDDGQPVTITHGNYISLLGSPVRQVRKDAFQGLYSVYAQFDNTLAAAFGANVKQAVFYARARGYATSRQHSLEENEIPEQVYDNLIQTVRRHLPLLHRYVQLRKRALGLEEIHMYDLYVSMVSKANRRYTYEEAKTMVLEGLAPLGEEYISLLKEGFENRWIDVYENKGKRSGAYSWGAYGTHPYVLMNFHGTLNDVFTLAHEMGHALHSYYSDQAQPYCCAGYKIFVAEVASTCNEALLIRHLLKQTADPVQKRYLLNHFLESFRGTLFRQTMFAEFEWKTHEMEGRGEALTAKGLEQIYHQLNVDYFGPEMIVDREIDYEWARIPHFYTPFYVYQYATGFSAAVAISSRILAGDEQVLEGYRSFLKGGCSMPPIELLKLCGVDMSVSEPVEQALKVFEKLLEEFADFTEEK